MSDLDRSRAFFNDVKRLIIKVGTAVVTRADGRLALGRLGALCEQIKDLNSLGYEVIVVTSGAVGLGRQRLKYRRFVNSSFSDLQKPQVDLDGKACAAVGQNSLMALYDTLFSQLDVTSAQLLVTDRDFKNKDFRKQLDETVQSLLALRVIPVFNENDAVSTRKAPYEDSSGIFWDNDSLAALLALELKADLLVLLSDVEGLYSGPPSDPRSKLIHTYIKEIHQSEITFGDKSRVGRGGMTAKVKAAVNAAYAGIPVVITSGYAPENIIKVLQGERVGTLFHQDAHLWAQDKEVGGREMAVAARESSRRLQALSSQDRKKILLDVADALEANEKLINIENEADVAAAQEAGLEKSLISRLALKPGKIRSLANSIRVLANMDDPIGCILKRIELADGLILEKTSSPLGVLLIIFESRPDALVQIASLAIRSGNGLLLKGGKEAKRSNAILHKVITTAIPDTVGGKLIGLVTSRDEIPDLLKLDDVIDLVIPRGSSKLVSKIKSSTKIPVLGHADGICHVYVDKSANIEMAKRVVLDAKVDYPAACNAMETLLVHQDLVHSGGLNELIADLLTEGVLELPEGSSFSDDQKNVLNDLATAKVPVASQVILPTRKGSRRKMDLKRAMIPKRGKSSVNIQKNQINRQDGAIHLKDKLSCSLSSPMVRRWCTFEWFYSAVDYPWFAKREFVEYLNHVGLGHIPRLTRVEWGVIRSSLGRPRRFSERFLHEEREKLQQYRESVRKHYMELRMGLREGLPTDLARPLSVGQRVIAIHPKTRELHDGGVLTVDHDQCRVQFDRAELGVEFVKDIDCMPSNPLDNMPEALRRQGTSVLPRELHLNGKSNAGVFTASEHPRIAPSPKNALVKQAQVEVNCAIPLAKGVSTDIVNVQGVCSQPSMVAHIQPKESDIQVLSELNRALDRKASSALLHLRQHNTYPVNNLPAWLKPPANSCFSGMPRPHISSFVSQESGSAVLEIVRGSRLKAHNMVDVAVQAISSMKEGEDTFVRIGEALDSMDRRHLGSEYRVQMIRAPEGASGGLRLQNQLIPSMSEPQVNSNASRPQSNDSDKTETVIPSELISSCVAALLMIQTCSERQYPPSDVAQIIDSAVTSLQPCCPQNLPIYREIQMCMGRIKTQILALIPT